MRMLGYKGPAQPSPMLRDALNVGFCYLEVHCLGCDRAADCRPQEGRQTANNNADS
jgi:hypothetical protein